jgi:hypothetical protein
VLHLTPPDSLATHFLLSSDRIIFQGLAYILTVEFFAVSRQKLTKYLARSCPKCNGYLGIVVPERKAKMPVQAINGH